MADSEDEYDKKIRDKFRGERTESFRGIDRREDRRPRDDFIERYCLIKIWISILCAKLYSLFGKIIKNRLLSFILKLQARFLNCVF